MKYYEVSMIIALTEEAGHPRKWIPDAVYENMEHDNGEDILRWNFKELSSEELTAELDSDTE